MIIKRLLGIDWRAIAVTYTIPVIFLLVLTFQQSVSMRLLTADVPAVTKLPTHVGLLSNLGILGWAAAVTICAFTAALLWKRSEWASFFTCMGLVSLLLLLDDMFLIHERVLPAASIPEEIYYVFYPLLAVVVLFAFRRNFRRSNIGLLVISVGLLAFSIGVDLTYEGILDIYHRIQGNTATAEDRSNPASNGIQTQEESDVPALDGDSVSIDVQDQEFSLAANLYYLAEDGSKFLGIFGWIVYLAIEARSRIAASFRNSG